MILDIIAPGVLLLIIVILLINNLAIRSKNRKLSVEVVQIALDKAVISQRLKEELEKKDSDSIEKSEGFLKFISQSRDWAFDYIEQVQAALLEFRNKIEPQILYSKTYGTTVGESTHSIIIDKISDAYDDLVKVMPEDSPESKLGK
jgi:pantothenate synthetase